jgi:hypothetical protein
MCKAKFADCVSRIMPDERNFSKRLGMRTNRLYSFILAYKNHISWTINGLAELFISAYIALHIPR